MNPSKQIMRGRRLDWLAQQLITKVIEHYLQRQHAMAVYFKRNLQQEKMMTQTVQRAADIPDDHGTLPAADDAAAEVQKLHGRGAALHGQPSRHGSSRVQLPSCHARECVQARCKGTAHQSLDKKVMLLVLLWYKSA